MNIDPDIKLENEIWIAPDASPGGNGTKDKPYNFPVLDSVLSLINKPTVLRLKDGFYKTAGFKLPKRLAIIGGGPDKVRISLISDCKNNFNFPHIRIFADDNWSELFYAYGFTLDGNWMGQSIGPEGGNFKVEPLAVKTIVGKVENVRVIEFGSSAAQYGQDGLETFPLSLQTFSNGAPFNYLPIYNQLINKEDTTRLEIVDCLVERPHFIGGGYCTAIFVKTNQGTDAGDRQEWGIRNTQSARITNNTVRVPGGIAYGSAFSEAVEFKGNIAIGCKSAFNFDTGKIKNLIINNNSFINCNQGPNIFSQPGSNAIIKSNVIYICSAPFFNTILSKNEPFYGICAGSPGTIAEENYIFGPNHPDFKFLLGLDKGNNQCIYYGGAVNDNSGEVNTLKTQLSNAQTIITNNNSSINTMKNRIGKLEGVIKGAAAIL